MAAGSSARSSKLACPLGLCNNSVASRGSGVQLAPSPVIEDPWRGQLQCQVREARNRLPAGGRQQPEPPVRRPLQRCIRPRPAACPGRVDHAQPQPGAQPPQRLPGQDGCRRGGLTDVDVTLGSIHPPAHASAAQGKLAAVRQQRLALAGKLRGRGLDLDALPIVRITMYQVGVQRWRRSLPGQRQAHQYVCRAVVGVSIQQRGQGNQIGSERLHLPPDRRQRVAGRLQQPVRDPEVGPTERTQR